MLAGRRPYIGDTPAEVLRQLLDSSPIPDVRTVNKNVSPKVAEVLARMCAKRPDERLASPTAVIEAFARIGYAPSAASGTEFAPEADAGADAGPSMEELVAKLPGKPANASLTLATQDAEMQEFVSRLKRKKLLKRVLVGIGVAAVLAAIILGICFSVL
jgi:hypothetical protein